MGATGRQKQGTRGVLAGVPRQPPDVARSKPLGSDLPEELGAKARVLEGEQVLLRPTDAKGHDAVVWPCPHRGVSGMGGGGADYAKHREMMKSLANGLRTYAGLTARTRKEALSDGTRWWCGLSVQAKA